MSLNDTQNDILGVLDYPMSATAIARRMGYSKANKIINDLDQLVSDGYVEKDDSGNYATYKKVERVVKVEKTKTAKTPICDVEETVDTSATYIPEGYTVGKIYVRKSTGQEGRVVTTDKNVKIFLATGCHLLIINGEPITSVRTPTAAMKAIVNYAKENNMSPMVVEQAGIGTIGSPESIKMCGIIDLKITKYNKAA